MKDIFAVEEKLRETYLSYLRSPFRLRHPAVAAERDELLRREGSLYQPMYLEFTPSYKLSGQSASEVAEEIGAPRSVGGFLEAGLFPEGRQLYEHQKQAWKLSREGKSVIVTSGTGSGKTECFLAPLFASIAEEMIRGGEFVGTAQPALCYWRRPNSRRTDQRTAQSLVNRPAAVRGLVMYPLNALVEDQLARLREACDSPQAREWLDSHACGDRIWFGRYTGQTPVPGEENDFSRNRLRDELRSMDNDWRAAIQTYHNDPTNDPRRFFQNPESSEMWSRWDMQNTPPDILITNYSMLNIMLMRDLESNIWTQTRHWLESDPRNVFHLVIDELHSYRGTAGSEVAFLLRTLLARLGVAPDSPQVRILATSASIEQDSEESLRFLADFFGRAPSEFRIVPGEPVEFADSSQWREAADAFASISDSQLDTVTNALSLSSGSGAAVALANYLSEIGILSAVDQAVRRTEGNCARRVTLTTHELAAELELSEVATRGVVRALAASRLEGRTPISIRGHLFFHAYGRLWACSNPTCTAVEPDDSRRIGKLYDHALPTCSCGARVLELLVCQQCGEAFLGGYVQEQMDVDGNVRTFLSPDAPDFMNAPDRIIEFDPGCEGYRIFWPSGPGDRASGRFSRRRRDGSVTWGEERVQRTWQRAGFDCHSAELDESPSQGFGDGFTYVVDGPPLPPNRFFSSFPSTCPHCGQSWARRRQYKNLIRRFSGGFARSAQVLSATLLEVSGESDRRTIVFTDSRSDAARLSTSIKVAHYKELLRTLASIELAQTVEGVRQVWLDQARWAAIANQAQELWESDQLKARDLLDDHLPDSERKSMLDYLRGLGVEPAFLSGTQKSEWGYRTLLDMRTAIFRRFIDLGMNPGGPLPSMQGTSVPWWRLFDDAGIPVVLSADQVEERALVQGIAHEFIKTLVRTGLQASSHRDFESLGFGFMWLPGDFDGDQVLDQATATVIRILIEKNRWDDVSASDTEINFPKNALAYLQAVDATRGVASGSTANEVINRLGQELQSFRLLIHRLVFCVPLRSEAELSLYVCGRCGARHLHASAGVCWVCNERIEANPSLAPSNEDSSDHLSNYYRLLVREKRGNFPFAAFELTGQTTSEARRSRQRRFQDVFLAPGENRKFQRVSLLSVTTTMEAGVDIGSLRSVVLGNMPPVRFNYQQRVGRCGRRGTDFSIAVTLSRGRSHDDYYFAQPRMITSERTPAPFLDVKNEDIALRVIRKEVLLHALRGNPVNVQASDNDVHGPFGATNDWISVKPSVEAWISQNEAVVHEIVRQHTSGTLLNADALANRIIVSLVQEIDEVTADPAGRENQLGRHLAYRGLFPMFGFPTRVRNLFLGGLNSEDSVVRDMDQAIGRFAPGSQEVWEDRLYTAIGCEHRVPRGRGRMERKDEPLGAISTIGLCKRCLSVTDVLGQAQCNLCGANDPDEYREIEMCQPRGFFARADLATDYRERFEFSPRALTARLAPVAEGETVIGNARLSTGSSRLYRVNDNSGNLFHFSKKSGEEVWFTQEAESLALDSLGGTIVDSRRWFNIEDHRTLAIGQISTADSTIISLANGADELGHLNLSLATEDGPSAEGRSAWFSAAYLLQRAAAELLDVDPEEFVVGVQQSTNGRGQIFITDKLENGSGYTSRISQPRVFQEILERLGSHLDDSMGGFLRGPIHEESCATACYRCLMSYANSPTHPLLDWRLGLDMIKLLTDGSLPTLTTPYWERYRVSVDSDIHKLLRSIYVGVEVRVVEHEEFPAVLIAGHDPLLIHHPLISRNAPALQGRLSQFLRARRISLFRLLRAPWSAFFVE